jgi:phage terminase large subunit
MSMAERARPRKRELRLELEIPRKHHEVLFSGKRHLGLCGGRGGAKSTSAAAKILIEMCRGRKRVGCFRQYQGNIRESSKELLERMIRDNDLSDQFKSTEQEIVHRGNGGEIIFIGLERNLDKVRALIDLDLAWIDEAQNANQESLDTLIPTLRKLDSQLIYTWNPTDPRDPVELTFRNQAYTRDDVALAFVNWDSNPWFYLTGLPAEMAHLRKIDPAKAAHIWDGLFNQSFDAVVFNRRLSEGRLYVPGHVRPVYGMDFGFVVDPCALVQVYPLGDKLYIAREIVAHGISNERVPELLDSILPDRGELVTADSADPRLIDYLRSVGFAVRAAEKPPYSVLAGVKRLKSFEIVVDPSCPHTLAEFRRLRWRTERNGQIMENVNPIGSRHCLDAIRYGCQDVFPGPPVVEDRASALEELMRGRGDVIRFRPWG